MSTNEVLMGAGLLLSIAANTMLALSLRDMNRKYLEAAGENVSLRSGIRKELRQRARRQHDPQAMENGRWKEMNFRAAMDSEDKGVAK